MRPSAAAHRPRPKDGFFLAQPHRNALDLLRAALQMLVDDAQVTLVCLEEQVERVACDRDRADGGIDRHVADHARDLPARQAELARFPDDVARQQGRNGVADARHEADDRVRGRPDG